MLLATPALADTEPPGHDFRQRRSHRIGAARYGGDRWRLHLGGQNRARGFGRQQRSDGQGAAGAEGRQHRGEGYPDLAAVIATANPKHAEPLRPADDRRLPRQQSRDYPAARRHQGRQRDRHAGGRGRKRHRRHQLHGVAASKLLDQAREQAFADARRKAEIYAKAAGVTLGTPLSISEGNASAVPMEFRARWPSHCPWPRPPVVARRRDAVRYSERVLGDQASGRSLCIRRARMLRTDGTKSPPPAPA